ncbi:GNAT family N-acetyltransferase [Aeromicrobium sp. CF3.5]|uniref:GNAT family N-acetyltransferase n=1 Tax=Aeromicrobium sp. CF3.5 TaxID=3373078 RepID=UPI003EE55F89
MAHRVSDFVADRWLTGWVRLRGLRVETLDGWPLVHVNSLSRRTELICADPSLDVVRELLPHVADDPEAMLTVVGADLSACRAAAWGAGVRVARDDETLMTTHLSTDRATAAVPPGLHTDIEIVGSRLIYRVIDSDRVAAEGTLGIDDGWATFDEIETLPSHRRRGLGRHVMTVLSARAVEAGATQGILAATADGRALYESLGWTVERELISLVGESEHTTSQ